MHIVNMEQKSNLEVPIFGSIDYITAKTVYLNLSVTEIT